jgi:hypothetical protein
MTVPVLETMKTVAGILNAERVPETVKSEAEGLMSLLISIAKEQAQKVKDEGSPFLLKP